MIILLLIYLTCLTIDVVYFVKHPICFKGWNQRVITYGHFILMIFLSTVPFIQLFCAGFILSMYMSDFICNTVNLNFLSKPFKVLK
jgi:hypothetical protein